MEASCASTCHEDQVTEEFCFEVPITNINNNRKADVLSVNNHFNKEASSPKILPDSECIVIDETDYIDGHKDGKTEKDCTDCISIDIDGKDKMVNEIDIEIEALQETINKEIINNNHKVLNEIGTTIDLDETDTVKVCSQTDSDVIILDGNKTDSNTTIILTEDEINTFTKKTDINTDVIDVEKDTDCSIVESSVNIDNQSKNGVLSELIQKCLSMENSGGMSRVINRTLLVIFKDVDEGYKKSDEFRKVISDTIIQLNVDPERKFSHIKNLCDVMKQHKIKKRVPFITLDEDTEQSSSIPKKRRKVYDVIELDDDNETQSSEISTSKNIYPIGKVYPPINLESSDEDDVFQEDEVIILNKENKETENTKTNTRTVKNKRPVIKTRKYNKFKKIEAKAKKRALQQAKKNKITKNNESFNIAQGNILDPGMLLEPRMSVGVEITESNQSKIQTIEKMISQLKDKLEILEETEVLTDTILSPYIVCERIKTSILQLYRQLCQLTGTEATKRHEVRLQVVPGHPEGPVRCLEEFLNNNIDEDGNPPFPDMADVLECVWSANIKYNLHWNSAQIMNEAHALFTQFGQSMQKRRQNREWKDLMSLVKQEVIDPADEDPALLARLEDNKRIAKRNELDLLERYAKMEHGIYPNSDPGLRLRVNESDDSEEDTDIPDSDNTTLQISRTVTTPSQNVNKNPATTNEDMVDHLKITHVTSESVISTMKKTDGTVQYESTVSVSNGNIVIQPSKASENTTLKQKPNENTHFVSEYSRFLDILKEPPSKKLPTNRVSRKSTENPAENSEGKATDLEKVVKIAQDIISLFQQGGDSASDNHANTMSHNAVNLVPSHQGTKSHDAVNLVASHQGTNSASDNINHVKNISLNPAVSLVPSHQGTSLASDTFNHLNKMISLNPTVRLPRLNINDFENNEIILVRSASKNYNSNASCVKSEILNTKDVNTNNDTQSKLSENIGKDDEVKVEDVKSIKPEPLDIPSMLEELGEGYTATIFDIEDPFLVIEISDSSESEDESD